MRLYKHLKKKASVRNNFMCGLDCQKTACPWKEDVCGQGDLTLWGMEQAETLAIETKVSQAARESRRRTVSYQVCQYILRMGFSVEGARWEVSYSSEI